MVPLNDDDVSDAVADDDDDDGADGVDIGTDDIDDDDGGDTSTAGGDSGSSALDFAAGVSMVRHVSSSPLSPPGGLAGVTGTDAAVNLSVEVDELDAGLAPLLAGVVAPNAAVDADADVDVDVDVDVENGIDSEISLTDGVLTDSAGSTVSEDGRESDDESCITAGRALELSLTAAPLVSDETSGMDAGCVDEFEAAADVEEVNLGDVVAVIDVLIRLKIDASPEVDARVDDDDDGDSVALSVFAAAAAAAIMEALPVFRLSAALASGVGTYPVAISFFPQCACTDLREKSTI
jgi:hypothetical protein